MWNLILLILAGLYTLNPYDILPDLMIGWGWIDDVIIWILLWRYFVSRKKKYSNVYSRFYQQAAGSSGNERRGAYSDRSRADPNDQPFEDAAPWDPYRILGIERGASAEEIRHAYRELANKYHPDKVEYLGDEFKALAEMRFKKIQQAYQELTGKSL